MSTLFKKVTSAISVGAILASTIGTSIVAASSEFLPYAEALADANIINKQSTEAGYRLADSTLRQEVAKMALGLTKTMPSDTCAGTFSDVSATKPNSWVCGIVEALLAKGLVSANTKFRPEDTITRAEALKLILNVQGIEISTGVTSSFNDVQEAWQVNVTETALAKKIISANASFRPNALITRGELFKVAANTAGLEVATDDLNLDDLFGDNTGSTNSGSTGSTSTGVQLVGDVTVALNPASPASQSVPVVGTVSFAKYDIKAGSADVSLSQINLVREGLGNRSDFSRVWMEKNGVRVTGRQSIGSDGVVAVTFSPALVVKAGATESLDLVATLSGTTTGGQHKFTITKDTDVVSSAKVGGTFPLSTATMSTAAYTVIKVDFAKNGSASTYKVGDKSVELGQFKLRNDATDDKNATFKSITLRNDGTGDAAKNLENLSIYKGATKISSGIIFDGKKVTFAVNDSLAFGRTETYYVRGDIASVANTAGDNYILTLQNSDDINVVEAATGFKASITGVDSSVSMFTYSVTGGDVILSKTTGVVGTQTVAPGTNEVVLASGDLKVAQAITLQDLSVSGSVNGGTGTLYNLFSTLKLKVGNSVVATYTPASTDGASFAFRFDGTFSVSANTTISIIGNVKSNAPVATINTFKFSEISVNNFLVKEYVANGNSIQSTQIVGSTAGISTTIGQSALILTRNDGISAQKLAVGSQAVTLLAYDMKANDVSAITVSKLKFAPASNDGVANMTKTTGTLTGAATAATGTTVTYTTADGIVVSGAATFTGAAADSTGAVAFPASIALTTTAGVTAIPTYAASVSAGTGTGDLSIIWSTSSITRNVNTTNVQSVRLYVNNTKVSEKSMSSGNADFNDINFTIPKNGVANIKVVADFGTAITPNSQLSLALANADIDAKDPNGVAVNIGTAVSNGPLYTFINAGTATIAAAGSQVNSKLLTPIASAQKIARLNVTALDDDLTLTDLYLKDATATELSSRLKDVKLYDSTNVGTGKELATATITAGGKLAFNIGDNSNVIIPRNGPSGVTLEIYAVVNDIQETSYTPTTFQLVADTSVTTNGAVNGARLISKGTTNVVTTVTNTFSSNTHKIVRSKATVAFASGFVPDANTAYKFTVTPDATGKINLTKVALSIKLASGKSATYNVYRDSQTGNSNLFSSGVVTGNGTAQIIDANFIGTGFASQELTSETTFYVMFSGDTSIKDESREVKVANVEFNTVLNGGGFSSVLDSSSYSDSGLPTIASSYTYK